MSDINGKMKQWNATNGVWDLLYPKTIADNIISGVLNIDRIPDIPGSKINSMIDPAFLPAIAVTDVVTDTTMAHFLTIYSGTEMQKGDVLILTDDKKTYIHNGGDTGDATDFTILQTPTDLVSSVAGKTGVVTLSKSDVGLGNVNNYGIATQAEAEAGTLDSKYMTPLKTKQAILHNVYSWARASSKPSYNFGEINEGNIDAGLNHRIGFNTNAYIYSSDGSEIDIKVYDGRTAMTLGDHIDVHNLQLINLDDPTADQHAATKKYVDSNSMLVVDTPPTSPVDGQLIFEY